VLVYNFLLATGVAHCSQSIVLRASIGKFHVLCYSLMESAEAWGIGSDRRNPCSCTFLRSRSRSE
jgi:hypothetical protein